MCLVSTVVSQLRYHETQIIHNTCVGVPGFHNITDRAGGHYLTAEYCLSLSSRFSPYYYIIKWQSKKYSDVKKKVHLF